MAAKYRNLVVVCQTWTRVYRSSMNAVRRLVNLLINQHVFYVYKILGDISSSVPPPHSLGGVPSCPLSLRPCLKA